MKKILLTAALVLSFNTASAAQGDWTCHISFSSQTKSKGLQIVTGSFTSKNRTTARSFAWIACRASYYNLGAIGTSVERCKAVKCQKQKGPDTQLPAH